MEHIVLVGGGLASTYAAAQLRSAGYNGQVTILSEEAEQPYDHVPLSKDYLYGGQGHHRLYLRDADFYRQHGIDLELETPVTDLEPDTKTLHLGTGETLRYSSVLLATGARPRRLDLPGADELAGVHYLRTLHDATALRHQLHESERVVVIGAGFLGCEVAASATMLGKDVTLISRSALPLQTALGEEMATVYRDLHAEQGVELLANTRAVALHGRGSVEQVSLDDGSRVQADTVVVAVGATPRSALAEHAGLQVNDGIVADASLATSAPAVFAAGDVASVRHPRTGRYERREHFNTARTQGKAAARSMLGEAVRYDSIPFFFTDQYEVWMEYTGSARGDTELVVHGDVSAQRFVAFWVDKGRLQAVMNVGLKGVPQIVRPLIRSGEVVTGHTLGNIVAQAQLADAGFTKPPNTG